MEELDPYLHHFWGGHTQQTADYLLGVPSGVSPNPRRRSLSPHPDHDILAGFPAGPAPHFSQSLYDIDDSIEWTPWDRENFMTFFERNCSPFQFSHQVPIPIPRPTSSLSGGGRSLATELTIDPNNSNTLIPSSFVENCHAQDQYQHQNQHNHHGIQPPVVSHPPVVERPQSGHKSNKNPSKFKSYQIKLVSKPAPAKTNSRKHKIEDADVDAKGEPAEARARKIAKSTPNSTVSGEVKFSIVPPELARRGGHGALKELTDEEKRSKALVRQFGGGCFRCRMLNKKCHASHTGICPPCKGSPHLCFRLDLDDCSFFRSNTPIHIVPVSEHTKVWASDEILELKFHCVPLSVSTFCEPLVVSCRRFVPQPGDNLKKSPGGRQPDAFIEVQPYIAYSSEEMYKTLLTRMTCYRNAFMIDMMSQGTSPVTISIMKLADHLSKLRPNGIVHCALDIWVGAHLNASERSLCGEQLLGMPPNIIDDETSFLFGYVPIPPQLDNQLDNLIIKGMVSSAAHLLKTIWTKFKAKKKTDWLELWVTVYIILNTVEFVLKTQQAYVEYLGSTFHRDKILAHWDHHRNLWSWSGNHLVDAFEYYHKKLEMPLGALLRKETLPDAQTYTDIKLDNEAFRMMRQIGEHISVAVRTYNLETAERPRTPQGRAEYETMWTSRIIFVR
ncbi:hypothetical protein AOL_s00078g526 [Orbilia oligospora ATCC 24927]|uniref:Zn(2)-C6 fungal-type domain-containing protein n=1 Tax=Arthrobotrys oligospora (strain ATCC 24927 / CBS 115.81 / DSM 1491) TaxID=756982 RepID=G1XC79_ARTOA|nr:hypothetical protein AOL_s00078g526 [Orbilia oligospora ATCC 24927]EGX49493.1 hypothetical protein AOL_s00078g526 [Orbilia oligospora ATCC 24927]